MPRVVIELQANTQDAVQKIQQFARAQKDAFDAVKAGTPALADAQVKVSKLTEVTGTAATATTQFNQAAKNLAQGGIRELAGEVPVVGNALAQLAGTLKGFPGLLGAIVGVGAGVITWLRSMSAEATKTLTSITALSTGIQTTFQQSILEVQKIRAQAAGDESKAITLGAEQALRAAEDVKNARIAKAREELEQLDIFGRKRTELSQQALTEIAAAEAEFAGKRLVIEAQGMADLDKLRDERVAKTKQALEEETKATADAAAAQQRLMKETTRASVELLKTLGPGFEEITEKLEFTQVTERVREQIGQLNAIIARGGDVNGLYAQTVAALTTKLQELERAGVLPVKKAIEQIPPAVEKATQSLGQLMRAADAALGQAKAAIQASLAQQKAQLQEQKAQLQAQVNAPHVSTAASATVKYYGPTMTDVQYQQNLIKQLNVIQAQQQLPSFQRGGLVPGTGPVPILAHGGELVVPPGQQYGGAAGGVAIRIEPGAIQVSGTVIDQQRGWATLVEELGQALEARLRRR